MPSLGEQHHGARGNEPMRAHAPACDGSFDFKGHDATIAGFCTQANPPKVPSAHIMTVNPSGEITRRQASGNMTSVRV